MSEEHSPLMTNGSTSRYVVESREGNEDVVDEAFNNRLERTLSNASIMPMLKHAKTFSSCILPTSDVALPMSINNPINYNRRLSLVPGNDLNSLYERVDSLKLLRPFKLIGKAGKLIDWEAKKVDISTIKSKKLRQFYEDQNELIDLYEDVDMLLDTGVTIEMIQNYADNTSSEGSGDEEIDNHSLDCIEEGVLAPVSILKKKKNNKTADTNRGYNNLPNTPGNIDLEGAKIYGSAEHAGSKIVQYAIYFNFGLNVILLLGKLVAVMLSDSLSLVASLVDSALDFLSTLIIFIANRYAMKKSSRFPVGRKQLEPIGVMIFSVVMIISFSQVFIESAKKLVGHDPSEPLATLSDTAIFIMLGTIVTKVGAYILCKSINNSSIQALVEDAKTDIVFNVFSLIFPFVGHIFQIWWLDALGAASLCMFVMVQWVQITFEHVNHLSGSHASKESYQQVLYLILRFSDSISKVKNYRMYHIGDLVNVEVDIVLRDSAMSLKDCHDLGESVQYAIETLPYVNRCFVHMDYRVRNFVGHLD
ncbi:hypothetical protein CANINC_003486 [Pichia inconspicua]|uniref:Cation efflux protein transmembrane domain-containing protein n=1 Tax=Pichia inconspicua TaxID=52247 RepID=A0A4T0WZ15_9ASCO|nr:hypothetical protein CANINC_003486 [[Candida] inconspicua]